MQKMTWLMSSLSILLGTIVLLGWYTHNSALIQVNPAFVPMQYNTALGFLLCGAGLLLISTGMNRTALILAVLAFAIGSLTLVEYVVGIDLRIDQIFMEHYIGVKTSHPGRMAPNTALCFSLTGLTLFLSIIFSRSKFASSWIGNLGAIVFALGVVAFGGYMAGIETAYGWGALTKMAVHTAVGFMVLGVGLIFLGVNLYLIKHQELPQWLPWPILISGLTISAAVWQAVRAHENKILDMLDQDALAFAGESLFVLGVLVTLLLISAVKRTVSYNNKSLLDKKYVPWIVIVLGIVLSGVLQQLLHNNHEASVKAKFETAVRDRVRSLEQGIVAYIEALHHIRASYEASTFLDREEFKVHTARDLKQLPGMDSLQWAPFIPLNARSVMEERTSNEAGRKFIITEIGDRGQLLPAAEREYYFPILYLEPFDKNKAAFGFDIATSPNGLKTLWKAVDNNVVTATGRVGLAQKNDGSFGVIAHLPIFESDNNITEPQQRRQALLGFAVAVIDVGTMIENILIKYTKPAGLELFFEDVDAIPEKQFLYQHQSQSDNDDRNELGLELAITFPFVDRKWRMTAIAVDSKYYPSWSVDSLIIPLFICLLSFAVGIFLWRLNKREDETIFLLKENELIKTRFELSVQGSGAALWEYDNLTKEIWFSPRLVEMLGYKKGEIALTHDTWVDHIHPDDIDEASSVFNAHLENDAPYDIEYRMRTKSGKFKWFRGVAKSLCDDLGKVYRTNGSVRDISLSKATEQRITDLMESTPDPMVVVNQDGVIVTVNKQMSNVFDYQRDELLGSNVEMLLPENTRSDFAAMRDSFFAVPSMRDMGENESRYGRRKAGGIFPVEVSLSPITGDGDGDGDGDGESLMIAVIRDITIRKTMEEELKTLNYLAESALRLTKSAYWQIPLDDSDEYISSKRNVELLGDPVHENMRYSLADDWAINVYVVDPDIAHVLSQAIEDVVNGTSKKIDFTYPYKRPADGHVIWLHTVGYLGEGAVEQVGMIYGVSQDISEAHEAKINLLQAIETADDATKAKSNFLANMSHEIRTPMNAIIGFGHLALQTDLNRKQHDYLNKISSAANNLLGIIDDILDFSKIEAGKMDMECIDFDLVETLDNFSNMVAVTAEEKGLEFLINLDPEAPMGLKGDPLRLNQILINLTNNAVKFTTEGEVLVSIDVVHKDSQNVSLRFTVKDSGIGMTDEHMEKLFQAFSQADGSTSRKFGGTGLGLTISQKLVELMGGELGVESVYGEGSTFFFTANFGIGPIPQLKGQRVSPKNLKNIRALIIDDNETSRTILTRYLVSFGYIVGDASSGEAGLKELEQADPPYNLVLMDWKMLGMNGLETTQMIHASASIKEVPKVLMVSAYGRKELKEEAENIGIDSFLVKPVNPSTLLNAIFEAFGHGVTHYKQRNKIDVADHIRGAHILLVEDNEINQQVAEELLTQEGMTVVIADNGKMGISALEANPDIYDAILMDIQMPIMDGYTATELIRQDGRFKDLPIIAMTANVMEKDRQQAKASGMNDHIAKPIDVKELFDVLGKWINVPENRRPVKIKEEKKIVDIDIPELNGIDKENGLQRTAGNKKLYLKIITKFKNSQAGAVERISAAIDVDDYSTAEREAHTLKGLAGSIGAKDLQQVAADVEKQVIEKNIKDKGLDELNKQLSKVIESLQVLDTIELDNQVVPVDAEKVKLLLIQLHELLEDDDSCAGDVLDELLPMLPKDEHIKEIADFVNQYEFEGALDLLKEIDIT